MRAERAVLGSWLASALGVAGVLVPKCPLCVAAYLCLFGISAGSAQAIVELGVPLCLAVIGLSVLGTALLVARRGRRAATRSELSPGSHAAPPAASLESGSAVAQRQCCH